MKSKGGRYIPVGYAAADIASIRPMFQDVLACGPANSSIDFYAVNIYEWVSPLRFREVIVTVVWKRNVSIVRVRGPYRRVAVLSYPYLVFRNGMYCRASTNFYRHVYYFWPSRNPSALWRVRLRMDAGSE